MRNRDNIIAKARKFTEQGRFDLAIRAYEGLLADDPDDLRSRAKLGFLHARNGDPQAAILLWLETAHGYEQRGAATEAAVMLQQVLQLDPDHLDAHLWLAELFEDLGQPAESRHELEAAHTLLEQRGRIFEALRVLEDMVALDPGNVALCIRLGEAYASRDRKEDAAEVLSRAADVLRVAEWVDDFIRVAERLVFLQPDNVVISKELAMLYLRQRQPQLALQKLQACYEADQTDPDTLRLLGDAFVDLRQPEKAATILRVLAEVFEQRGELDHADAVLDHANRLDPALGAEEVGAQEVGAARARVGSQPRAVEDPAVLQVEEGDWVWQPPDAVGAEDLSPLEMSLQASGPEEDAPRRFLPAVTAEGRHGREVSSPRHRTVTTQELDLSDLMFLEQRTAVNRTATTVRIQHPDRGVNTTELDLADLEEVESVHSVRTQELEPDEPTAVGEAPRRPLSTQERDMSELEELAGDLSERYLGTRSEGGGTARDRQTVKYRRSKPLPTAESEPRDSGRTMDTSRSQSPRDLPSERTELTPRPGGRRRR